MGSWRLLVTMLLCIGLVSVNGWLWRRRSRCRPPIRGGHTRWHAHITFKCPKEYQSISVIKSNHQNCKEDRSWLFKCAYNPAAGRKCYWSQWVNNYDQRVNFYCGHEGFITGVESVYSGHARDRRFKFRCCYSEKFKHRHCHITHYMNNYDGDLDFYVPWNYYLSAVASIHHNGAEDRRWKFQYCKLVKRNGK